MHAKWFFLIILCLFTKLSYPVSYHPDIVTRVNDTCGEFTKKKDEEVEIERHLIDVNGDGVKDTLILIGYDVYSDPNTYENIKIKTADGGSYLLECIEGYRNYIVPIKDLVPSDETYVIKQFSDGTIMLVYNKEEIGERLYNIAEVNRKNIVRSNNIYVIEQTSNGIIMLVWGFAYGDCSKEFAIIQFYRGTFIFNKIINRVISSVSLSDSGDMITIRGYKYCTEREKNETFYIPVSK